MTRSKKLVLVAATAAMVALATLLGIFSPLALPFDDRVLYGLRGVEQPPNAALIIGIDTNSLQQLAFDLETPAALDPRFARCLSPEATAKIRHVRNSQDLPRTFYACLLDLLTVASPKAIAMDVHFANIGSGDDDNMLATSLRTNGKVVLLERVKRQSAGTEIFERALPIPILAKQAAGSGFFQVEKTRYGVRRYLARISAFPNAMSLAEAALRVGDAATPSPWDDTRRGATAFTYRAFRFYGPAGTVPTLRLASVLGRDNKGALEQISGKTLFIGQVGNDQTSLIDALTTPFGDSGGKAIPGVELVATAFLNAVDGADLSRLDPWRLSAAVLLIGIAMLGFAIFASGLWGLWGAFACAGIWLGTSYWLFSTHHVLVAQTPVLLALLALAVVLTVTRRYVGIQRAFYRVLPAPLAKLAGIDRPGVQRLVGEQIANRDVRGYGRVHPNVECAFDGGL